MTLTSPVLGSGSAGGTQVGVPNVVGKTQGEAETILSGLGLRSKIQSIEADGEEGKVFAQNPEANSVKPKNTVVTLLIVKAPVVPVNLGQLLEDLKAAVDAVSTKVDPIAPAVEGVGAKVTTLDGKVDSTVTKLDTLTTNVDAVGAKVDGVGTKVDGLGTKVDGIATSVGAVATKVDGLDGKVDKVSGTADGLVTKVDAIATAVGKAETDTAAEDRMKKILDKLDQGKVSSGKGGGGGGSAAKPLAAPRRSGDHG
jgi:outer membrane murein-binding lipoprotein Lpp